MTNQQQEAAAHDDNAPVTRHELQGMIRGFQEALNRIATIIERMTPRPDNNPLYLKTYENFFENNGSTYPKILHYII